MCIRDSFGAGVVAGDDLERLRREAGELTDRVQASLDAHGVAVPFVEDLVGELGLDEAVVRRGLTTVSYTHLLMGVVNQYPYQCKIMMTWMCNVIQATPGSMRDSVIERLCDPSILPLHIVCDIVMGEMAQYADYFVPDVTQYESFGLPTSSLFGASVRWEATTPQTLSLIHI